MNKLKNIPALLKDKKNIMRIRQSALFDKNWYLSNNPDIAMARVDPVKHYYYHGYKEGRKPSSGFDPVWYLVQYKDVAEAGIEPLTHYLLFGEKENRVPFSKSFIKESVPLKNENHCFEACLYEANNTKPDVRALAYYLPQFHPFEENNEWWGTGFTEWTNVVRGRARFEGHYQPHIPRDLGFYDLRLKEVMAAQIEMAKKAGIDGFCFYHYWFNGKRLMEKPINMFLENKDLDISFCLMWANENWTRRWDGLDNDVLISQDYNDEDDEAFVADIARHFSDSRYIRLDDRPLFFIYRPGIIPEAKEKIEKWRILFRKNHGVEPLIYMAQAFDALDPRVYGLDGAIEFPPHKVAQGLPSVVTKNEILDEKFVGHYPSYDEVMERSLADMDFEFDVIKAVFPMWDNEARKPNRGMGFVGSTPEKYEKWLNSVIAFAKKNPIYGKHRFVAINAWNEWAEGAHLEPDIYWGHAYLNATYRALYGLGQNQEKYRLLLVGHDAHKHGAQLLLLNIFKTLRQRFGVDATVILLNGGDLVEEYEEVGKTYVCNGNLAAFENILHDLNKNGTINKAICNTTVTGAVAKILSRSGIKFISLIHELEKLINEYGLEQSALDIKKYADKVLFASSYIQKSFEKTSGALTPDQCVISPQGIYQDLKKSEDAKSNLCLQLGIPPDSKIIVNVGYADLRKGFDLFLGLAKAMSKKDSRYHFVWVGSIHEDLKHWLLNDVTLNQERINFHSLSFTKNIAGILQGADAFAMTSREDPFPSVVLESLALGTPVVGFEDAGGFVDILEKPLNGQLVPYADITEMARAIEYEIANDTVEKCQQRESLARIDFNWNDYVFSLLEYIDPVLKRISVIVPNYNYEQFLKERLMSVFNQTYPVYEVIVLDDSSSDNSLDVIESVLAITKRDVDLIVNKQNSGSVFRQWFKGATRAKGNFIWIAEADDVADSHFLSAGFNGKESFHIAYADSRQIDESGMLLAENYHYYYDSAMINKMKQPGLHAGVDILLDCLSVKNQFMNVSAMLFETESLRQMLDEKLQDITGFKVAGDWCLYVNLLAREDTKVRLFDKPLNVHRRHAKSVTGKNLQIQLAEIERMHAVVRQKTRLDERTVDLQSKYLDELRSQIIQSEL